MNEIVFALQPFRKTKEQIQYEPQFQLVFEQELIRRLERFMLTPKKPKLSGKYAMKDDIDAAIQKIKKDISQVIKELTEEQF